MVSPLWLGLKADGSDAWLLPIEPRISRDGRNALVVTPVAKGGAVRRFPVIQRWPSEEMIITIEGLLMPPPHLSADEKRQEMERMVASYRRIVESRQPVYVVNPQLELWSVSQIAIESDSCPYVPGEFVVEYRIQARADQIDELLVPA